MKTFGWLHLSDLHQGMAGQATLWPNVKQELYDDLARLHDLAGPWDLVLFTGDLTQRGSKNEFTAFTETMSGLWDHLQALGSSPTLLSVPGNHDLVRPSAKDPATLVLANWDAHPEIHDEFWENSASPYRKIVETAFANYVEWQLEHHFPRASEYRTGLLPGDFIATLEKNGRRLGIMGMNSAFLQLTDTDYQGKLALGAAQIHNACDGDPVRWARQHDVCVLLTHHPSDWLSGKAKEVLSGEIFPPGRFAVHLFGHMHEGRTQTIGDRGAEPRRLWQGYSLFGLENWGQAQADRRHGYAAGRIDFRPDSAELRIWPRVAKKRSEGHRRLVPDTDFDIEGDQGTPPEQLRVQATPRISPSPSPAVRQTSGLLVNAEHATTFTRGASAAFEQSYYVQKPPEARPRGTPSERPTTPRSPDDETRIRLEQIEAARQRRKALADSGLPTELVDNEILQLRRLLRAGGQLKSGSDLGNRYTLIKPIGEGGYGVVWEAHDRHSQTTVAIKVLHSNIAGDIVKCDRFFRGAERMEALDHPAVVKVLDKWGEDDGFLYYSMRRYAGGHLGQAIERGDLSDDQILGILLRIADAVAAAHTRGWIHRDIKPANILLDEDHEPYLGDFELIAANDTTGATRADEILGTFFFSAPEMVECPQEVTARADVYSLGMTLLFCLSRGRLKRSVLSNAEPAIRSLTIKGTIKTFLKQALKQDTAARFADGSVFRDALDLAIRTESTYTYVSAVKAPGDGRADNARPKPLVQLVQIPGGTVHMGADDDDGGRGWTRPVTLSPYLFAMYPVTVQLYNKTLGRPVRRKDANIPVEVTRLEAIYFCNCLSELEGLEPAYFIDQERLLLSFGPDTVQWNPEANGYRLPTEAEWELAARGTDGRLYPWGNNEPTSQLQWCGGDHAVNGPGPVDAHPHGASPFGVHDMVGNISEWCWDWYGPRHQSAASVVVNPTGPRGGAWHVVRGGDWRSFKSNEVRATSRVAAGLDEHHGIRLARPLY